MKASQWLLALHLSHHSSKKRKLIIQRRLNQKGDKGVRGCVWLHSVKTLWYCFEQLSMERWKWNIKLTAHAATDDELVDREFACINSVRSVVCSPPMSSSTFCITMGGSGGGFFSSGCRRRMDTPRRSSASKYTTTATMLTVSPFKPNGSSLLSPFNESKVYQTLLAKKRQSTRKWFSPEVFRLSLIERSLKAIISQKKVQEIPLSFFK